MTTHFPDCKDEFGEKYDLQNNSVPSLNVTELVISMINEEKV